MTKSRKRFGQLIRKARWLSGESAQEWAALLGVRADTVWRWERGDTVPPPQFLSAVLSLVGTYLTDEENAELRRLLDVMVVRHALRKD